MLLTFNWRSELTVSALVWDPDKCSSLQDIIALGLWIFCRLMGNVWDLHWTHHTLSENTNWLALKRFKKGHFHWYVNDALIEKNKINISAVGVHSNRTSCKACTCYNGTERAKEGRKLDCNARENRSTNFWNPKKWKAKPPTYHFLKVAGGTSCKEKSHHTSFGCMKSPPCCEDNHIQVWTSPNLLHCQPNFLWEKDIFGF